MKPTRIAAIAFGLLLMVGGISLIVAWTTCRVFVPHDKCLVLIRKNGLPLRQDQLVAEPGQKGIQAETLGPGRYFFNPFVWDWELHDLIEVSAGNPSSWKERFVSGGADANAPEMSGDRPQVGILVNKVGLPSPTTSEVVDDGYQGIQKRVLTPGTYRINPYVYKVEQVPAVFVPLGCCGVVTSQLGEMPGVQTVEEISVGPDGQPVKGHPKVVQKLAQAGQRGVQEKVLPPGVYYLNPYVYKVQIVQVGYNQISQVAVRTRDAKGVETFNQYSNMAAPQAAQMEKQSPGSISTHISFPSKDGFNIDVEVTVVWGRHPKHLAEMLNRFGDIEKIKQIILSQMRSICRNLGSEYESTDFIRGEKREQYQHAVTDTLQRVCHERDIEILIALIHNIEVRGTPETEKEGMDLKKTIQRGYIAKEQDLTKQTQRETAKVRADLETSKVAVEIAREQITADTRKKAAEAKADGEKKAQEIMAARDYEVAVVERQIAELDSESTRVLGKAKADVEQMHNQAEAQGKQMMIGAFGSGSAYNLYMFAQGFSPESVRLIFAGEGTFWTDLSRIQDAAAYKVLEADGKEKSKAPDKPGK